MCVYQANMLRRNTVTFFCHFIRDFRSVLTSNTITWGTPPLAEGCRKMLTWPSQTTFVSHRECQTFARILSVKEWAASWIFSPFLMNQRIRFYRARLLSRCFCDGIS